MAKLVYGAMAFSASEETILAAATPAKALGTTTALVLGDFTMSANNRLRYDGVETRDFEVDISVSMIKSAGGATNAIMHIHKNDVHEPLLTIERTIANTSDTGAISLTGAVTLEQNDYVEIWVETVNGDNLTIALGQMVISVLG